MIRANVQETVGQYLSSLMDTEMTHFLGRKPYERCEGDINHRNGSYDRKYTLKGIGFRLILKSPEIVRGNLAQRLSLEANSMKTLSGKT
jgi:transposase-like protein